MKEVIRAKNAPCPTTGPYSQAIKAGKTLYIAGTCGENRSHGNLPAAAMILRQRLYRSWKI